jgi:hypothetical protein
MRSRQDQGAEFRLVQPEWQLAPQHAALAGDDLDAT